MKIYKVEYVRAFEKSNYAVFLVTFINDKGDEKHTSKVDIFGDTGKVSPAKYQSFRDEICNSPQVKLRLLSSSFIRKFQIKKDNVS